MVMSEAGKAVSDAVEASTALYKRAAGRDYTRDEKRLLARYDRIVADNLPKCGTPATKGLLPTESKES